MNKVYDIFICVCFLLATLLGTALLYHVFGPAGAIGTLFFTATGLLIVESFSDTEDDD